MHNNPLLNGRFIHKKGVKDIKGIRFAGFGSSNGTVHELIPIDFLYHFNPDESYDYLCSLHKGDNQPQVVLTHTGPRLRYGNGFIGDEYSTLDYIHLHKPALLLCSHNPDAGFAVDKYSGTVVACSGNLGRNSGQDFGKFLGIDLDVDDEGFVDVEKILPYKVVGNEVKEFPAIEIPKE